MKKSVLRPVAMIWRFCTHWGKEAGSGDARQEASLTEGWKMGAGRPALRRGILLTHPLSAILTIIPLIGPCAHMLIRQFPSSLRTLESITGKLFRPRPHKPGHPISLLPHSHLVGPGSHHHHSSLLMLFLSLASLTSTSFRRL